MTSRAEVERELTAYVAEDGWPAEDPRTGEPVAIEDTISVGRLLWQLRQRKDDLDVALAVAEEQVRRIQAFVDDRKAGFERAEKWASHALEGFMRYWVASQVTDRPKKTLQLADGTLKMRSPSSKGRIEVHDLSAFVRWATTAGFDAVQAAGLDWEDSDDGVPTLVVSDHPALAFVPKVLKSAFDAYSEVSTGGVTPDGDIVYELVTADGEQVPGVRRLVGADDTFHYTLGES